MSKTRRDKRAEMKRWATIRFVSFGVWMKIIRGRRRKNRVEWYMPQLWR